MPRNIVKFDDFSGGLDLSRDLSSVAPPYTPYAQNFRITKAGDLDEALKDDSVSMDWGSGIHVHDVFVAEKSDGSLLGVFAAHHGGWKRLSMVDDGASVLTSATAVVVRSGMTNVDHTTFEMHNDKLYGLDPLNDIGVWDGSTLTTYAPGVDSAPPRGIILGVWEGKMWVAEATAGELGLKVVWSDPFDATTGFVNAVGLWPTANNVTLGGSATSGERIVGGFPTADGLAVFTNRALYLIYDSDNGFNTLIDANGGTPARHSLVRDVKTADIYGVNATGVFRTNGRAALEYISGKIEPMFTNGKIRDLENVAGCIHDGSYWFSYSEYEQIGAQTAYNQRGFEINLQTGSVMHMTGGVGAALLYLPLPSAAFPSSSVREPFLLAFRAESSRNDQGGRYLHRVLHGTTGDAQPAIYTLPFIQAGRIVRVQDVRLYGRGYMSAHVTANLRFPPTTQTELDALPTGDFVWEGGAAADWPSGYPFDSGRARIQGARGDSVAVVLATDPARTNRFSTSGYAMGATGVQYAGAAIATVEVGVSESSRRFR